MTTISKSFTAKGVSDPLPMKAGQSFTYSLSGTYSATLLLERSFTGGQSWEESDVTASTANATVSGTKLIDRDCWVRWRCTVRASGTAVTSLADVSTESLQTVKAADGASVIETTEAGQSITGTLSVSGLATLAAGLTLSGIEDSITATASGNQATAFALSATKLIHRVTVVGTDADSVALPAATLGAVHLITNADAGQDIQVFGTTPDTINGVATATGVAQGEGVTALYICVAAGKWVRLLSA